MDRCMITHSLLSSWLYALTGPESERDLFDEFKQVLNRVPTPTTDAMQNGIDFEDLVTAIVEDSGSPTRQKTYNYSTRQYDIKMVPAGEHMWFQAAKLAADIVQGGQLQCVASKEVEIRGLDILLYGRLDALKAGTIYDIKFSPGYERGKYIESTQHPMYFELVPEADRFSYLVSNGTSLWTETYAREEAYDIKRTVSDFLSWLDRAELMEVYLDKWKAK